jgi:hypothetical protein
MMRRKWWLAMIAACVVVVAALVVATRAGKDDETGSISPSAAADAADAPGGGRGDKTATTGASESVSGPGSGSEGDEAATTPTARAPQPGDPVPPADPADGRTMFAAFAEATWQRDIFDDESEPDWYAGYSSDGAEVQVYAATAPEAEAYCAQLVPVFAWFTGSGALTVGGLVAAPDGSVTDPGYPAVTCAAAPAVDEPVRATAAATPAAITRRATEFVDEYYGGFLADNPWFVGVEAETDDAQRIVVTVFDDPANQCPKLRAITDWFMHTADGTPVPYELIVNDAPC